MKLMNPNIFSAGLCLHVNLDLKINFKKKKDINF